MKSFIIWDHRVKRETEIKLEEILHVRTKLGKSRVGKEGVMGEKQEMVGRGRIKPRRKQSREVARGELRELGGKW